MLFDYILAKTSATVCPIRDGVGQIVTPSSFNIATFSAAEKYDFDVKQIVLEKMEKNALKYPVDKSKGSAKKYTDF